MTRYLQILMPMAGAGSRFANAGYSTPKPLIEVDGHAMFMKALSSLDNISAPRKYIFVIRQEHVDKQNLDNLIRSVLPEAEVVILPEVTRGAAETALSAKNRLDPNSPLIVMDCDLWFKSQSYADMVSSCLENASDLGGGLLTFEADNPRYSYAKVDDKDLVLRTAEKKVISNHAITGAYFFANAKIFTDSAEKLMHLPINEDMPEYYMSLLYNILLDEGKKIQATYVDEFASFGTPEELQTYQGTTS